MPPESDDSIIDVTGLFQKLEAAMRQEMDATKAAPAPAYANTIHRFYEYEPPSLARFYREKLSLTARQISWLNRFPLPSNTFLSMEAGREATVRLYLGVLPLLEQQLKAEGSTLAQTVKTLDSRAKSLRYYASTAWYYTPPKTGADAYLAIFRLCESAVRGRFGHKRKMGNLFGGSLAELEPVFEELLGQRVRELLPLLLAQVPAPDYDTELHLNEQNASRWKPELELLLSQPATDVPALLAALEMLIDRNQRNPAIGAIYQELTRRLAATHREAALGYHLRHLHTMQTRFGEARPLPKALHKQLFAQPEQAGRFQVLVNELAFCKDLPATLAKVPGVYVAPRKKIELDKTAIHAVRDQHAGTVALLNEYLQDEPAAAKAKPVPKATKAPRSPKPAKAAAPPPAASPFAAGLHLTAPQQALLHLFAAQGLALPQAEVEALATAHGTLRNQLVDGLNEACYELLDDVLVEESGDGYTVYEAYFRRLVN